MTEAPKTSTPTKIFIVQTSGYSDWEADDVWTQAYNTTAEAQMAVQTWINDYLNARGLGSGGLFDCAPEAAELEWEPRTGGGSYCNEGDMSFRVVEILLP